MTGNASIARKSLWTIGTYAASTGIRFASNVVLSRLLGPEILGVMVIAQAIRAGCDLLTDLGPEQNVVHSPHGDDERFLNSLWTIKIVRGLLVSLACLAFTPLLAGFYRVEWLILALMSAAPLLTALMSTSVYSAARHMDVKARNLFELVSEAIGLVIMVVLAVVLRNVWAPIIGILLSVAVRSALTYAMPRPRHRFLLDPTHTRAILHFGKWIMLSSLSLYAAVYVDRLVLGRAVPLATLGIYGLAKAVSDLPGVVAGRLAFQIVFPFVARHKDGLGPQGPARAELAHTRRNFLLLVLLGIATVMAWSDRAVLLLYGPRYAEAGWMLCVLLVGGWIAVLSSLNEATVFGRGEPRNVGVANTVRFVTMAAALIAGYELGGLPGALLAMPLSEVARYAILMRAQVRLGTTFVLQDIALTLGLAGLFGSLVGLRLALGLGVPWALIG